MPCTLIAEIGINHTGCLDTAKRLIDVAVEAGCDAVKFQKRTPGLSVPAAMRDKTRETPWGLISYLEYRERVEFGEHEYDEIERHCAGRIEWFASAWDIQSAGFLTQYQPRWIKIPSARATDHELLDQVARLGPALILSTGACDLPMIRAGVEAVENAGGTIDCLMHCTSTYPCPDEEINLRGIETLRREFPRLAIGYSGHEAKLPPSIAAAALGATMIERHITLDRTMWGSDQAASLEPHALKRLVSYVRAVERAMGDGEIVVYPSELKAMERLRLVA